MSAQELRFLEAFQQGELQTILELAESKAVDPSRVVDERYHNILWSGSNLWYTDGWTPLHFACV